MLKILSRRSKTAPPWRGRMKPVGIPPRMGENEIIQAATEILKKSLKPSKIILFGLRAKENNREHSDFDFALDCDMPSLSVERRINEEIEKISGLYKVDIIYLGSVDKEFKEIVLKTGKVVFCSPIPGDFRVK